MGKRLKLPNIPSAPRLAKSRRVPDPLGDRSEKSRLRLKSFRLQTGRLTGVLQLGKRNVARQILLPGPTEQIARQMMTIVGAQSSGGAFGSKEFFVQRPVIER